MEIDDKVITELIKGYKGAEDLVGQNGLLKQLTKRLVEAAMNAELTGQLGYGKHERATEAGGNARNGTTPKKLKGDFGEIEIETPRDRNGEFEPQIVRKHQRRFDGFDDKILSMYARGLSTREIEGHLKEIYGVDVSASLISDVTDSVVEDVKVWQTRPLEPIYPVVFLDALYVKMRHEGRVENRAVYVVIGINLEGAKEVLGVWTSGSEGARFWLSVLTDLPNRGVKDMFIACADGLKGAALHCSYGAGEPELCNLERPQRSGGGPEADLSRGQCRTGWPGVSGVHCEVDALSVRCQAVARELGAGDSVFRLSARGSQSGVYNQCGRVAAHVAAQSDQNPRLVSGRRGGVETAVSGAAERLGEVEDGAGVAGGDELF
jgi:hypothetical protein